MEEHLTVRKLQERAQELENLISVKEGSVPQPIKYLDFSNDCMQPHTDSSYIPDLTQGELQPLEYIDDDLLEKLDLDAIIAESQWVENEKKQTASQDCAVVKPVLTVPNSQPMVSSTQFESKLWQNAPPPLQLYPIQPVHKSTQPKIVPSTGHFLPPVSD